MNINYINHIHTKPFQQTIKPNKYITNTYQNLINIPTTHLVLTISKCREAIAVQYPEHCTIHGIRNSLDGPGSHLHLIAACIIFAEHDSSSWIILNVSAGTAQD